MNKFKVGDKVKLRDSLEVGRDYGGITFLRDMKDFQGKELTIDRISRQGNYILKEGRFYYSEEMLEKVNDTDDLLEFALSKLNMTKEELRREHKKNKINEQELEDIKRCCDNFGRYCNRNCCNTCAISEFKRQNSLNEFELGRESCILIYKYLFEKEGE